MSKNKVIEIFMKRDGLSFKEAKECLNDLRNEVNERLEEGDYTAAEDIFFEYGLEMDYIFDVLI